MNRWIEAFSVRVASATRLSFVPLAAFRAVMTACLILVAGGAAAQEAPKGVVLTATPAVAGSDTTKHVVTPATKKGRHAAAKKTDDADGDPDTGTDDSASTAPVANFNALTANTTTRAALTSAPMGFSTGRSSPGASPMVIAPGDPRYPLPAEPNRAGLILGTGGLIGGVGGALSPTLTSLLNPGATNLTSGALNLSTANVTSTFQTLGIGSLNLVNLTPVSTSINGTLLGQNQHLTLLGGVTSGSYITNVNRGTDGFFSNGIGGILLPGGAPAWSSDCASLLGIPLAHCWAVNPAQDNQVIVGDKASANGSQEVVIGRGATHTLPVEDANTVFPGDGRNDPNNPTGVPTNDFAARKGNSVVIGDSASGTANAQTIIGANATSSQVNSVALGNASIADRAGAAGYAAYGLTATQNSVGAVSIGSTGNERQLTHVAAGSDNFDAVNVLQLKGAIASASALDPLAVNYDADGGGLPTNSVTLTGAGTGAVGVHNVLAGSLAAGSLDAVNGTQLNTTNQAVAAYFGGTTAADAAGVFTAPTFNVTRVDAAGNVSVGTHADVTSTFADLGTSIGNVNTRISNIYDTGFKYLAVNSTGTASVATGVDAIALGAGASATLANSLALGTGSTTMVGAQTGYTAFALAAVQNSSGEVNIGNRQLTGVAAGSADHDAVNVLQLRAVSDQAGAITNAAVTYDLDAVTNARLNHVTLTGGAAGPVGIGNLANGRVAAASVDAINGGQLFNTNAAMTQFFGAGAAFDPILATFTAPAFALRPVDAAGNVSTAQYNNAGDAFASLDGSVNVLNTRINGLVAGLAMPYVAITSTQAAASATGLETTAVGGGTQASANNAAAFGSLARATAVGALAAGAGAQASTDGSVAIGANSVANRTGGGTEAFSNVAVPVQGVVSVGSSGAERQITNVAGGSADTDAVNVRQLRAVSDLAGSIQASAVQYDDTSHTRVTLHPGGAPATIANVAAGAVVQGGAEAINGGQLWQWTQNAGNPLSNIALYNTIQNIQQGNGGGMGPGFSVNNSNNLPAASTPGSNSVAAGAGASSSGANSTSVGNGAQATADNSVAVGAGSVADRANTVSVGSASAPRQVTNVAAGTATTDAANVGQLNQVADWSKAYTDERVGSINRDIEKTNNRASAGVASAMAMAGLPQATTAGRSMAAVAGGTFRGESGIAVGVSTISDTSGWVYKLSGTANSRGDAGFSVGAGMEW